jgi:membrane protease YdiL (CAAX protease family)
LLNRGLGTQWRFLGAQIGWGWLITSILFAAAHVVFVDRSLHITFMFEEGVGPLVGSLIGGWLRERTGSIWPMVVLHNISNVLIPGLTLQIAV